MQNTNFIINDDKNLFSRQTSYKDDIYNLSVRKYTLKICGGTIEKLDFLEKVYLSYIGSSVYNKYCFFIKENRQIKIILKKIYKLLSLKDYSEDVDLEELRPKDKNKRISTELLIFLINDVLSLSTYIDSDNISRELMLCSHSLAKQLMFVYKCAD